MELALPKFFVGRYKTPPLLLLDYHRRLFNYFFMKQLLSKYSFSKMQNFMRYQPGSDTSFDDHIKSNNNICLNTDCYDKICSTNFLTSLSNKSGSSNSNSSSGSSSSSSRSVDVSRSDGCERRLSCGSADYFYESYISTSNNQKNVARVSGGDEHFRGIDVNEDVCFKIKSENDDDDDDEMNFNLLSCNNFRTFINNHFENGCYDEQINSNKSNYNNCNYVVDSHTENSYTGKSNSKHSNNDNDTTARNNNLSPRLINNCMPRNQANIVHAKLKYTQQQQQQQHFFELLNQQYLQQHQCQNLKMQQKKPNYNHQSHQHCQKHLNQLSPNHNNNNHYHHPIIRYNKTMSHKTTKTRNHVTSGCNVILNGDVIFGNGHMMYQRRRPQKKIPKFLLDTNTKKILACGYCHYITDRKNNLKRHILAMHKNVKFSATPLMSTSPFIGHPTSWSMMSSRMESRNLYQ
ncbi:hypothetical protein HELRODRAFT_177226 [Helobdella robusta]|uniref:C2H2-type domain-containing protein n=1 Tax=Helobdella robusta TaxID=6412 RepID=T1FBD7_HELRO|nr:hypothetical protein HELRODRAFT_177226 [Helobdella robusta]ESN98339.1 hypothetical protein HELRODRAFT_177226 [Helobdella robusta]